MPVGTTEAVPLFVSGGSVRVLRAVRRMVSYTVTGYMYRNSSGDVQWRSLNDLSAAMRNEVLRYEQFYGYIVTDSFVENKGVITVNGTAYDLSQSYMSDASTNFGNLGLCEGVISIRDEENETVIACGLWYNGALYVPYVNDTLSEPACYINVQCSGDAQSKSLRELVTDSYGQLHGTATGITVTDLEDIMQGYGLTIRPIDCSEQLSSSVELHALPLQAPVNELWLNG